MPTKNITILFLLASIYGCFTRPKIKTGLEGKPLPSFNLLLADSLTHFNTTNIATGKPIVLFCFAPYCPYCKAEMDEILANMKKLNNVQFYIFTNFPFTDMKKFYDHYQLQRYPNIIAGIDYTNYFMHYYTIPGVPYLAIYDTQKRLKQVLVGNSDANNIKDISIE